MTTGASFQHFETARLRVRPWGETLRDPSRAAALYARLQDILTPAVLAHLPPSMQMGGASVDVAGWVAAREAESDVSLIWHKADAAIIGLCIFARFPAPSRDDVHLGYLLAEDTWGQGYASELLQGMAAANQNGAAVTLIGGVGRDNPASARVLVKAGFVRDAARSDSETDVFVLRDPE